MRLFKSDWVDWVLTTLKVPDDVPIENKRVTGAIASAQAQVESQNFDSRKNVLKYDDVMNRQREVIYGERRAVLEGADLHEQIRDDDRRDRRGLRHRRHRRVPGGVGPRGALDRRSSSSTRSPRRSPQVEEEAGGRDGLTRESLVEDLKADAQAAYDAREQQFGEEVMRELERRVLLSVLDRKWREHLYEMDYLREGIGLRAYSQRDPLVEYQREGFDMFRRDDGRHQGGVRRLPVQPRGPGRGAEVDRAPAQRSRRTSRSARRWRRPPRPRTAASTRPIRAKGLDAPKRPQNLSYSAPSRGRRRRGDAVRSPAPPPIRRPVRRREPQRRVPVRLRQEVQEVPRRTRRADRPDDPRQRLTRLHAVGETSATTAGR